MRYFGSFKKLNAASADDIADVKGISLTLAQTIFDELKAWRS